MNESQPDEPRPEETPETGAAPEGIAGEPGTTGPQSGANPSTALPNYPPVIPGTDPTPAAPIAPAADAYPGGPLPYDPQAKSRLTAGLLGIFLGGFGVHRFYLGYTGIGLLQIFLTLITFGYGALWGIVEGIMILSKARPFATDALGRPLRD